MTDKEKIRKEVERLQKELIENDKNGFGSDIDNACILELQNVLTYIDSLQEDSVSNDLEEAIKKYLTSLRKSHFEGYDIERAFKKGAQWQKKQTENDDEKLSKAVKLADAMYYAAHQLTTDASHLMETMKDWWNFKNVELNNKE